MIEIVEHLAVVEELPRGYVIHNVTEIPLAPEQLSRNSAGIFADLSGALAGFGERRSKTLSMVRDPQAGMAIARPASWKGISSFSRFPRMRSVMCVNSRQ